MRKVSDAAKKPAERKPAVKHKPVSRLLIMRTNCCDLIWFFSFLLRHSWLFICCSCLKKKTKKKLASLACRRLLPSVCSSVCVLTSSSVGYLWTPVSYVAQAPLPAAPKRRVSQVEEERKKQEVQLRAQHNLNLLWDLPSFFSPHLLKHEGLFLPAFFVFLPLITLDPRIHPFSTPSSQSIVPVFSSLC